MSRAALAGQERAAAHRLSRARLAGLAWAALTVVIFSGWFVVTRFSVTRELRVWDITALRFGIGAVLLAPALFRAGARLPPMAWRRGLAFSLLWGAPFVLCVALGLQLTSAAQAATIAPTLMPVFAGLFAWAFLRERQAPIRWFGYVAIALGLVCLVIAWAVAHGPPNPVGIAALVLGAAMWAGYTLLFRRSALTPTQSAALICLWSALLFLPAYLVFGLSRLGQASLGEIAFQAVYQGALMSGVAIVSFNRAVTLLGSGAATAIIALLPAVAALLAIPVLGEVPDPAEALSIALIVAGVILAAKPNTPSISRHADTRKETCMIRLYYHPTPNPAKVALLLEETGLAYEMIPVDTSKGEQHAPAFRAVNPNGKVPAIVDTDGPGGREARVFDSNAILLYLAEKAGKLLGTPEDRPELLSWLLFIASGLGPFSGQAVHFQFAAPEGLDYARNRYRREAERHYQVLDEHLAGRDWIVSDSYTIADISAWGWLDRASRVLKGEAEPLAAYPNLKRLFAAVDARPAAARARAIGQDHEFKKVNDEETRRALFPSNYQPAARPVQESPS